MRCRLLVLRACAGDADAFLAMARAGDLDAARAVRAGDAARLARAGDLDAARAVRAGDAARLARAGDLDAARLARAGDLDAARAARAGDPARWARAGDLDAARFGIALAFFPGVLAPNLLMVRVVRAGTAAVVAAVIPSSVSPARAAFSSGSSALSSAAAAGAVAVAGCASFPPVFQSGVVAISTAREPTRNHSGEYLTRIAQRDLER